MKRRDFIRAGSIGIAAAFARPPLRFRIGGAVAGNPLRLSTPWIGGPLEAKVVTAEVWPGFATELMTLGGSWPGPLVRVRRGERFEIELVNRLDEPTTVHWHGLIVPHEMDGHPADAVAPGASRTYSFDIMNRAGTYWYHPHPHGRTAPQTYRGMGGVVIVEDDAEQALDLPRGAYDVPLMVQDRVVDDSHSFTYAPDSIARLNGTLGNAVFVNGTPDASLVVDAGRYRLRMINGSNARILRLGFSDGRSFAVIGTDGGLLDRPRVVSDVYLSPAERVEIVVDFADLTAGSAVGLNTLSFGTATSFIQQGFGMPIMSFVGSGIPGHVRDVPQTLAQLDRYDIADAQGTQTFTLDTSPLPIGGHHHKINGVVFEMHRIDAQVPVDTLQLWEIVNEHTMPHPIHIHGTQFQIVDRTTTATLAPVDSGWKDTVLIAGGETVRVLIRFTPYDGTFLFHCHNLEHEDDGMMINFAVQRRSAADELSTLPTELDLR